LRAVGGALAHGEDSSRQATCALYKPITTSNAPTIFTSCASRQRHCRCRAIVVCASPFLVERTRLWAARQRA